MKNWNRNTSNLDEHEGQWLHGPLYLVNVDHVGDAPDVFRGSRGHAVVWHKDDVGARQQSFDFQLVYEVPEVLVGFQYCILELCCIWGGIMLYNDRLLNLFV